jgi:RimJ/RimL family protein N-acetyltransferase
VDLETFTTERLTAERLTPEHLPDVTRMDQDPVLMATLGGVRDETRIRDYMARNLAHWAQHGYGVYIVREAESGRIAGRAVVRHYDLEGTDEIEIGYAFLPEFWLRGYASEIARGCIRVGHERLGRPTLIALTTETNAGSRRVLEKSGFVLDRMLDHDGTPHLLYRWRAPAAG